LFILDHNLGTRNARKSIEGSKDSDSSLVSNENLSKILLSSGWALGQATWDKMAKNLTSLMPSLTKYLKPKTKKFFFIAGLKTCQIFWGFEQLSSTISRGGMSLLSQVKLFDFRLISKHECVVPWQPRC